MTTIQTKYYPRVLSIAGSDSGGGAGIQADLKTFSALGCYGMTAITAVTAQNTQGVQGVYPVAAEFVKAQMVSVMDDIGVDAIKIGMLHSPEIVDVVAWAIEHYQIFHVVLDTVMVSTSGDALTLPQTVGHMVQRLFPLATVITPNLVEAGIFLKQSVLEKAQMQAAAVALLDLGARSVLLKGGHLKDEELMDLLVMPGHEPLELRSARIDSRNVHGTGCTLSSAVAAHLALGHDLQEAVYLAHQYILRAIEAGASVKSGEGNGPLNHLFDPVRMHVLSAR